jgi:hypothetical protein
MLFIIQILGIIYRLAANCAKPPSSVSNLLLNCVLVPLIQCTGPAALLSARNTNRARMREIVRALSSLDKFLIQPNSKHGGKHKTFLVAILTCILVLSFPLYFAESLMGDDAVSEFLTALSHLTWQINDMQYLNLILIMRHRLKKMNEKLRSSCVVHYFRNEDVNVSTTPIIRCRNGVSEITSNHAVGDQCLETAIARMTSIKCSKSGMASIIFTFREHYNAMYKICCLVNSINGYALLLNWLVFVVSVSVHSYHVAVSFVFPSAPDYVLHSAARNVTFILWTVLTVVRMSILAVSCQCAADECQRCMDSVQEMSLQHGAHQDVLTQLESFCVQLVNNNIEFTVGGMFRMNLSVLCTAAGLVTQFLILMFQMREHSAPSGK